MAVFRALESRAATPLAVVAPWVLSYATLVTVDTCRIHSVSGTRMQATPRSASGQRNIVQGLDSRLRADGSVLEARLAYFKALMNQ